MKVALSIFILPLTALCLSCHTSDVPHKRVGAEDLQHIPARGGSYCVSIDSLDGIKTESRLQGQRAVPEAFYLVFDDTGDATFSKDSLQVKGKWYEAQWKGRTIYLKVKPNRGSSRNALILFWLNKRKDSGGFKLVQDSPQR